MKIQDLKCDIDFYLKVVESDKTCEVLKNDRGYHTGDLIVLRNPDLSRVTRFKPELYVARIDYVASAWQFPEGLRDGYCVLVISRVSQETEIAGIARAAVQGRLEVTTSKPEVQQDEQQ